MRVEFGLMQYPFGIAPGVITTIEVSCIRKSGKHLWLDLKWHRAIARRTPVRNIDWHKTIDIAIRGENEE